MTYTVTIYRDGSLTPVEYQNVKHVFWTAGNTVLVIAIYDHTDWITRPDHHYVSWPREQFAWYKVERELLR